MIIPIESKQIAFITYDEQVEQMEVHFHSGEVVPYPSVDPQHFRQLLEAQNKYDALVQMTAVERQGHETVSYNSIMNEV